MASFMYNAKWKHTTAPSFENASKYGVTKGTKELSILNRTLEISMYTTFQNQPLGSGPPGKSTSPGRRTFCVGDTWDSFL